MAAQLDTLAASQLLDNGQAQTWEEQLRKASFRGIEFEVDSIDWTAGDNVVIREYPFQDLPTVFRMGAAAEELKFSAYVIGQDYHRRRAALMAALSGEGVLIHPTAGAMRVFVAGKFSVREAPTSDGGMARFDLSFIRAEPRRYPVATPSTPAAVATAAASAKDAAAGAFAAGWSVAGKPGWVGDSSIERHRTVLDGVIGPLRKAAQGLNEFKSRLNQAYRKAFDGLESLVRAPRQLADSVVELYRLPADMSNAAARDFRGAFAWAFNLRERLPQSAFEMRIMPPVGMGLVMYGTGAAVASIDTPAQRQLAEMTANSDRLVETLALAAWAEAVAVTELDNYDDALALRRSVTGQVQRLLRAASAEAAAASVPASSWYDAVSALHTAVLIDLQTRGRELVRLTSYTPEGWQPVWYISFRLFGTAQWADEIMAMNPHIQHPLLVPPGRPLRIVRHD